jgi:hypothetical protein
MSKQTWVYLMKDLRSGFIKIGESVNPQYRERTLQAEQPLIELIEAWAGTSSDEKALHKIFAEKRIRGEWFNLSEEDLENIRFDFFDRQRYSTGTSEYSETDLYKKEQQTKENFMRSEHFAAMGDWVDCLQEMEIDF